MGNAAIKALEDKKSGADREEKSLVLRESRIGWGSVIGLVAGGINKLISKFSGRKESTLTASSDVKITTDGVVKLEGDLTTTKHSNIPSLMHLMVPGTIPTPEDIYLPSYNEPIGVWNIKRTPVLRISKYSHRGFEVLDSKFNSDGEEMLYGYQHVQNFIGIKESDVEIEINPIVLEKIERYEKEVRVIVNGITIPHVNRLYMTGYYMGNEIGRGIIESTPFDGYTAVSMRTFTSPEDEWISVSQMREIKVMHKELPIYAKITDDFQVKVTVTLYPKAPYDSTPIVTTRTFKCDKDDIPISFK